MIDDLEQHLNRAGVPITCGECGATGARAERGPDSLVICCIACGAELFALGLDKILTANTRAEHDRLRAASPAAQALYDFIRRFSGEYGYAPTLREMQIGLGWSSPNSVTHYLNQLAAIGLIERDYGAARGIRLMRGP